MGWVMKPTVFMPPCNCKLAEAIPERAAKWPESGTAADYSVLKLWRCDAFEDAGYKLFILYE